MADSLTPEERRVLDHLVRLIQSGKVATGRIRPVQVTAINGTTDPPTINVQVLGPNPRPLTNRRFFSAVPLSVGIMVYAWQEGRDLVIIGTPTSINNSGWNYVGNPGQPIFENDWHNFGGTWQTIGFRRVGDEVSLRGTGKSNGAGAVNGSAIFTLGAGYLPRFDDVYAASASSGGVWVRAHVAIYTTGVVQYIGPDNPDAFALGGIRFAVT